MCVIQGNMGSVKDSLRDFCTLGVVASQQKRGQLNCADNQSSCAGGIVQSLIFVYFEKLGNL